MSLVAAVAVSLVMAVVAVAVCHHCLCPTGELPQKLQLPKPALIALPKYKVCEVKMRRQQTKSKNVPTMSMDLNLSVGTDGSHGDTIARALTRAYSQGSLLMVATSRGSYMDAIMTGLKTIISLLRQTRRRKRWN